MAEEFKIKGHHDIILAIQLCKRRAVSISIESKPAVSNSVVDPNIPIVHRGNEPGTTAIPIIPDEKEKAKSTTLHSVAALFMVLSTKHGDTLEPRSVIEIRRIQLHLFRKHVASHPDKFKCCNPTCNRTPRDIILFGLSLHDDEYKNRVLCDITSFLPGIEDAKDRFQRTCNNVVKTLDPACPEWQVYSSAAICGTAFACREYAKCMLQTHLQKHYPHESAWNNHQCFICGKVYSMNMMDPTMYMGNTCDQQSCIDRMYSLSKTPYFISVKS